MSGIMLIVAIHHELLLRKDTRTLITGVLTLKPIELDRLITRERCNRWRSWQEWEDSA